MRGGEEAEAHGKHVHIYEGDLGPGVESWGESNALPRRHVRKPSRDCWI